MKNIFLLICIVITIQCFGQKKYSFDYGIIYKEQCKLHDKGIEMIYLINSQHNDYCLYTHPTDSANIALHFIDKKGLSVNSTLNKNDFYKAETITTNCTNVFRFQNLTKENYAIENCKDTIISDTSYYHYKIFSLKNLRYQKRNKIVTAHFIINKKNTIPFNFTMTSLLYHTDFESRLIPVGIPKYVFYVNTEGIITETLELSGVLKTERFLTIPDECDYTKDEIRKISFNK